MSGLKQKKARLRLLNEVRDQLILQAARWGKKDKYTPLFLEEITLDQCRRVAGDLASERANLEYELHLLESNKRDLLIKMERLEGYLKKSYRVREKHEQNIKRQLEKTIAGKDQLAGLTRGLKPENNFSVFISSN